MYYDSDDLEYILGMEVTREALLRRGYILSENGKLTQGLYLEEEKPEDSDDESEGGFNNTLQTKTTLAKCLRSEHVWIKLVSDSLCEDPCRDTRTVILLSTFPINAENSIYEIDGFTFRVFNIVYSPFMENVVTQANFIDIDFIPEKGYSEVTQLVSGRYVPEGFDLIGKPMPEDKSNFHPNPPYSIAENSGWKRTYYHMQIDVDEHNTITGLDFSTWEREASMFARPRSVDDDKTDYLDCINLICDQYSDEEWENIKS